MSFPHYCHHAASRNPGSQPGSTPSSMREATRLTRPMSNILVTRPGSVEYPQEPLVQPTATPESCEEAHPFSKEECLRSNEGNRQETRSTESCYSPPR